MSGQCKDKVTCPKKNGNYNKKMMIYALVSSYKYTIASYTLEEKKKEKSKNSNYVLV